MNKLRMVESEFRALVAPVVPFVARSSAVHALEGVRIRTDHGRVFAEAAGAATLGICVRSLTDAVPGFDIVFPLDDLPIPSDSTGTIELEQTSKDTVVVAWSRRSALAEYDILPGSAFPDVARKIRAALDVTDRTQAVWVDAHTLAAFHTPADLTNNPRNAPIVFHPGATQHDMILVTCGDHFAGLTIAASSIPSQPTRTKYRVLPPPAGDPIELWKTQLSTIEGGEG